MRLQNKVALITGAGSGFGRASALLFSREGAKIAVVDIDRAAGEKTVELVREKGGDAFFLKADVSKAEDVEKMVNETIERYGRIDILFNNAGINPLGTVVDTTEETWNRTIDINLKGVFLGMKYTVPLMEKQGGGSIINTASINGLVGMFNEAAYDASKGGVVLLTKATALDFGTKNIRVNCICPGVADTPLMHKYVEGSRDPERALKELGDMNVAIKQCQLRRNIMGDQNLRDESPLHQFGKLCHSLCI
jgi:meso-butanediol dehydrogenase / (S,S)-butanediol dehydrogenase / diacetyl reductase